MIAWIEKYLLDDITGQHSLSRLGVAAAVVTLALYVLLDAIARLFGGGLDSASVMMAMGGLTTVATGGYAVNRITGQKMAQADAEQIAP